ncbi:response regulator [Polaribacter aquimarinus]|uniref:Response regulator n=1 Tax=Polaribacter aquimarinus TaxID=2100726 RepID=A0A2U2J8A5_9FLAO|nr:response regulator [Polaribacter aquimarinus]PWG04542.1 response regulator [Polaribacter aquimarinus]
MKSLSILLIDDDAIERMKFKQVCEKNNFSCSILEAENGNEALEFLNNTENSFDIVISDLQMPKMDGLELLKSVRNINRIKNIPMIIMSNSQDKNHLKKCYEYGISGYFTKPASFSKYSKKVVSLLKYWKRNELIS